jgi:hypothetical protein
VGVAEIGPQHEGDDEPEVEQQRREEPVQPEHDGQPGCHRDHEDGEDEPAPPARGDLEPERRDRGAREPEHREVRRPVRERASRVGHTREQDAEHRAEQVLLLPDHDQHDERHQHHVEEQHPSCPVKALGVEREDPRQQTHPLAAVMRLLR